MKSRELRIGNLLNDKLNNMVVEAHRIGLNPNDLEIVNFKRDKSLSFNLVGRASSYEPIPLTVEWLVKFGFENDIKHNLYQFEDISIVWPSETFFLNIWSDESAYGVENIKYVHQLQNLYFALTGKELTCQL